MTDVSISARLDHTQRRLAEQLRGTADRPLEERAVHMSRRQATVVSVDYTLGRCQVTLGGVTVPPVSTEPGIRFARTMTPVVGDDVWIEFAGGDPHIVYVLGPSQWTRVPDPGGSWTSYLPGTFNALAYRAGPDATGQVQGTVLLGAASVGATLFTLPSGLWPQRRAEVQVAHYTGAVYATCLLEIYPNGNIVPIGATNSNFLYLDGCKGWSLLPPP